MSVKRYELEIYHCNGGEMIVSDTGDYVSHDDYAALEAKCAALAAENAALKDINVQRCTLCDKAISSDGDQQVAELVAAGIITKVGE